MHQAGNHRVLAPDSFTVTMMSTRSGNADLLVRYTFLMRRRIKLRSTARFSAFCSNRTVVT